MKRTRPGFGIETLDRERLKEEDIVLA